MLRSKSHRFAEVGIDRSALPVDDVIALLVALAENGDIDAVEAVAEMLKAAQQGQKLSIDLNGLGIDHTLLKRVLEAAGS